MKPNTVLRLQSILSPAQHTSSTVHVLYISGFFLIVPSPTTRQLQEQGLYTTRARHIGNHAIEHQPLSVVKG